MRHMSPINTIFAHLETPLSPFLLFNGGPSGMLMRLCWDWRLARVFDDAGEIVDESVWGGRRGVGAVADRLERISSGRMTNEARVLAERFPEAKPCAVHDLTEGIWPELALEESELMGQAAVQLAQSGVAAAAGDADRRLEHLVRAADELRAAWGTLEARVVEWAGLFLPALDLDAARDSIPQAVADADSLEAAAANLETDAAEVDVSVEEWNALKVWAQGVVDSSSRLDAVEQAVRELSTSHLPSTSALIGPLLAARLCTSAHGRQRMARLPSGTIQVLGAEKAFFMHLRSGIPPPKHGHLFQHPWVNRSPRWVRGKVSRMLSGKVAIASRLDAFDGEPWGADEVAAIEQQVQSIRERHPRPQRRN